MGEIKIEMSTLDELIPKYYKGFDMDVLLQKMFDGEPVTEEEKKAVSEAQSIYRKKHFDEVRKEIEEQRKEHRVGYVRTVTRHTKRQGE